MKILQLQFLNLNSLQGEWRIDFGVPEYQSQGLFAITGPTGSGKSTLLDAICLALYGATPRLGKITKSNNEIMSRQTGECYAEVTFESQAGIYRCHWHQHRSRRNPEGNLIEAVHEISDARTGRILESKKRDVAHVIEEKTGMDFSRFTRSMLLAQGDFAAFLKASPDDRAPILEQITGTEIYSEISRRVHERNKTEHQQLDQLREEIAQKTILDEKELKQLKETIANAENQERELKGEVEAVRQAINWCEAINQLEKQRQVLQNENEALDKKLCDFDHERRQLRQALRVVEIEADYNSLDRIRKQQESDRHELERLGALLFDLEQDVKKKTQLMEQASSKLESCKKTYQEKRPDFQRVRILDQDRKNQEKQRHEHVLSIQKWDDKLNQKQKAYEDAISQRKKVEKAYQSVQQKLRQRSQDEYLVQQEAAVREQINRLQEQDQKIISKKDSKKDIEERLDRALQTIKQEKIRMEAKESVLEQIRKKKKNKQAKLEHQLAGQTLQDLRNERDEKVQSLIALKKIADLEQERKLLRDGQPCPLCGAIHHPYTKGQVPEIDEAQLSIRKIDKWIAEMTQLEEHIHKLASDEQTALEEKLKASSEALRVQHDYDMLDYDHQRLSKELEELKSQQEITRRKIKTALTPFGMGDFKEKTSGSDILDQVSERVKQWTKLQEDNRMLENQRQEIKGECERLEAVIESMKGSRDDLACQQSRIQKQIDQLIQQRQAILADQDPDDQENQLEKAILEAEKEEKRATQKLSQVQQDKQTVQAQIITLKEAQEKREKERANAQAVFEKNLKKANLENETAFLASRMPAVKREEIANRAEELDRQAAELNGKIKDNQYRLAEEKKRNITNRPLDELTIQKLAYEEQLAKMRETLGAAKQQQSDYEEASKWIKDRQVQIEKKTHDCQRWAVLHEMIGSADGKKFRNFAQGLTFERMIAQANRQLSHMSDRYLLVRDENEPLELDVIDNYQAGEIRSTKNLSGGESFIVSLALALGLSKMSSRQVRVDSLFLDEGFGTLDDDALEMALETLSSLQNDGKIIGIISHVPAIKERVRTQLAIRPISGGKSVIEGPGVHRG